MADRHDIRKEFRVTAEEAVAMMHDADQLGVSESDLIRMAFRMLHRKFIESGVLKDTGVLPE